MLWDIRVRFLRYLVFRKEAFGKEPGNIEEIGKTYLEWVNADKIAEKIGTFKEINQDQIDMIWRLWSRARDGVQSSTSGRAGQRQDDIGQRTNGALQIQR